jgi:endonuclease/exonuclease/phosphatase family metal-dependent hydrolase
MLADEPRVVLAALVDSPVGRLTVASTHLSFVPGWNLRQLRRTLRWLAALPGPRVLLGDLNVPMRVVAPIAAAAGWRPLARVATYPAHRPRVQFDHVLLHPRRTAWSAQARAPLAAISDHRPLVVGVTS